MRLNLLFGLFLVASLHVGARGMAQKMVTLKESKATLLKALDDLRNVTGISYVVPPDMLKTSREVTVDLKDVTLTTAIDAILAGQPFSYRFVDEKFLVVEKKSAASAPKAVDEDDNDGSIVVVATTEDGKPLEGATVYIPELKQTGITNNKGEFVVQGVKSGRYRVDVSYVGYDKTSSMVSVKGSSIFSTINKPLNHVHFLQ